MTSRRTGKTPRSRLRPPPLTVLSAPAGPGGPIQITVIHPGVHVIGWERVDADTTQRRPTSAPTTREAADPNPSPVPSPIAPPQRGIRAPRERRPRPRGVRLMRSPSILPRDAEVGRVGITRPPRRRPGRRRQTDAARAKVERKVWRETRRESEKQRIQGRESRIDSLLSNQRSPRDPRACMPTAISKWG